MYAYFRRSGCLVSFIYFFIFQKLNDYYDLLKAKSLVGSDMLDAFVSFLLDLLSLESVLVRQMVNKIFASISGQLKPDTLVRILKVSIIFLVLHKGKRLE